MSTPDPRPDVRPDVTTLGETMACLHGDGPLRMGGTLALSIAGAEANVAIGLARLGHRARWAGVVGQDELGALVLRTLRAEGVDVSTVRESGDRPTGLMIQESRIADITRVHYYRAGSAGSTLSPADATAALTPAPRLLHVTGITPALGDAPRAAVEQAVRQARTAGATVVLDVNHRSRLWDTETAAKVLTGLLPYVDLLIASDDELPIVGGRRAATDAGIGEIVIKRGADGAEVWTPGADTPITRPALRVPVASTVGAGDAFVAGYLSGLLDGLPPQDRLDRAVTLGAFAVASHGDWHALPTRAELPLLALAEGATVR
ncbi:2-dehydro-3-deoxygluconokinase [Thermocatellispora tengchongensis]|uniref:2-dehydro-3-deoxygluconokinase n=1 Tax=Thermocatellispora tengchongensis TaxID=1073253 RepID=A0A840P829_9ACTN|nr:sugar kinase [Thermocatellispora tengchongensis]MBB5134021.1 2-dehydro-3-deoxygluconokinase [Thermocatellispora tengchongensis]